MLIETKGVLCTCLQLAGCGQARIPRKIKAKQVLEGPAYVYIRRVQHNFFGLAIYHIKNEIQFIIKVKQNWRVRSDNKCVPIIKLMCYKQILT